MNLEKLAREIAMCKSPNVDKWLVPIADLESMIELIKKQEAALNAAPAPATPAASVDTAEFSEKLADTNEAHQIGEERYMDARRVLVAHIDADKARDVAAARIDAIREYAALLEDNNRLALQAAAPQQHAQAALSDDPLLDELIETARECTGSMLLAD